MRTTTRRSLPVRIVRSLLLTVSLAVVLLVIAQTAGLFRLVPVVSGSMSGFVEAGDVAVLRPTDTSSVEVGDVIAFRPPVAMAQMTLHRIVDLRATAAGPAVRTQGDANNVEDPWELVLSDATIWRAEGMVIPGAGRAALKLQTMPVRIGLLVLTLAALLFGALRPRREPTDDQLRRLASEQTGVAEHDIAIVASAERRSSPMLIAVIVLLPAVFAGAVSATLSTQIAAAQSVSTSTIAPPFDVTVELVCEAGVPTAVDVSWTAPQTNVEAYEILRGPAIEGPFTLIGTVTAPTVTFRDEAIDAVLAGDRFYTVRARAGSWTSAAADGADMIGLCASIDPTKTKLP